MQSDLWGRTSPLVATGLRACCFAGDNRHGGLLLRKSAGASSLDSSPTRAIRHDFCRSVVGLDYVSVLLALDEAAWPQGPALQPEGDLRSKIENQKSKIPWSMMRKRLLVIFAKVGLDYLRIRLDFRWAAFGNFHAVVEYGDALAAAHDDFHGMLDE